MRAILIGILLIGVAPLIQAQSIERSAIGTAGQSVNTSTLELDISVGEVITAQSQTGINPQLSQGYVQPQIRSNISVLELKKSAFSLVAYPNPVTDQLNIKIESAIRESYIYGLYDLSGRLVLSGNINGFSGLVNTGGLSNGTYVLKLQTADLSSSQSIRFVKM